MYKFANYTICFMKKILLFLLIVTTNIIAAQERYFSDPVKIPLLLSGSFAELRSNHFHSGIDIKTQGTTGLPVYAVADGYISRIVVSPTGYGRALYINHPNGTTTVYGHLLKFAPEVEEYVKDQQYEKKSFRIDLQVSEFLFPIKKDEEIAQSGNSGSSGGPHLHFEIRDTKSEEPLNPLNFNFQITDDIAPKIFSILLVPLSDKSHVNYTGVAKSYPIVFYDGKYHLKDNPTIPVWGDIGVAVQSNDYFNGTYNKCGINRLRMAVNGENFFTFQLNRFAFENSRYINSHIVYDEYMASKRRFIKTWHEPGNKLPIYNYNGTQGKISPQQDEIQKIELELQDSYGNTSILQFSIRGAFKNIPVKSTEETTAFKFNSDNYFENNNVKITIPRGSLYNNFNFSYTSNPSPDHFYTEFHNIHNKNIPLQKSINLKLKLDSLAPHLQTKAVLVNVDPTTEDYYAAGGTYKNGWIESKISAFGTYAVVVDTLPPTIVPLSIKDNALIESSRIRFEIDDNLSGVETIEGLLDGKWALFEYDPKSKKITHYFDDKRFELNKRHILKLSVSDFRDNKTVYEANFWK